MIRNLLDFYDAQRRIFGLCPRCGDIFRLSDCEIRARRSQPGVRDWKTRLDREGEQIEAASNRLDEREQMIREKAREIGRRIAGEAVRKIDKLFRPRRLDPDEAKVLFHPVDYLVFRGMKTGGLRDLVFLDREPVTKEHKKLQHSIRRAVDRRKVRWATLRVTEDGKVKLEEP